MYLLGYIPRDGRLYLANKDVAVVSYALSLAVVEYQTVVLRGDMEAAAELLESVPDDQKNKIARFLEGQGYKDLALEVATDPEHRFDLALALGNLEIATELARATDSEHKWKTVGDAALASWNIVLAQECFTKAKDLGPLLLLNIATGNTEDLKQLAVTAEAAGAHNIAFSCLWQTSDIEGCIKLLQKTNRQAEAALFTRTYKPGMAKDVTISWKEYLVANKRGKIAEAIGVPGEDEE
jgi:coatomer subunit beta'